MDYTSDDFLSETLYELSSCIIQCDYSIDVFRKKLESAISKGFQINYRDDNAGVIGYPLLIRAIWGPYHTGEELEEILRQTACDFDYCMFEIFLDRGGKGEKRMEIYKKYFDILEDIETKNYTDFSVHTVLMRPQQMV